MQQCWSRLGFAWAIQNIHFSLNILLGLPLRNCVMSHFVEALQGFEHSIAEPLGVLKVQAYCTFESHDFLTHMIVSSYLSNFPRLTAMGCPRVHKVKQLLLYSILLVEGAATGVPKQEAEPRPSRRADLGRCQIRKGTQALLLSTQNNEGSKPCLAAGLGVLQVIVMHWIGERETSLLSPFGWPTATLQLSQTSSMHRCLCPAQHDDKHM